MKFKTVIILVTCANQKQQLDSVIISINCRGFCEIIGQFSLGFTNKQIQENNYLLDPEMEMSEVNCSSVFSSSHSNN